MRAALVNIKHTGINGIQDENLQKAREMEFIIKNNQVRILIWKIILMMNVY